mmetsp:Transcript_2135/g.5350  ORF Transcript_2135/g.5350 Transcript_2135/m.5350 type:complete len:222 (+) Transcript_2135:162-827(+)
MFLPKITGSIFRRRDQLESHVPLNPRPFQSKNLIKLSPTLTFKYPNTAGLRNCKLLNAKRNTDFTRRHLEGIYRRSLEEKDREISLSRKLRSLTIKKSRLETKRLAFEAKLNIASSISDRYGVNFRRSELHLLSTEELEKLASNMFDQRRRNRAAKVIQKNWRLHRIKVLRREAEARLYHTAEIIQRSWRKFKVEVLEPRRQRKEIDKKVIPVQSLIRGTL